MAGETFFHLLSSSQSGTDQVLPPEIGGPAASNLNLSREVDHTFSSTRPTRTQRATEERDPPRRRGTRGERPNAPVLPAVLRVLVSLPWLGPPVKGFTV